MRRRFYGGTPRTSGRQLSVQGRGQPEGRQRITTIRPNAITACPKTGCERYEKGYSVVLNLGDPRDANVARYIREGKAGRHIEEVMPGVQGLIRMAFPPGYCPGHRPWERPVYIVGERKTTQDEWHHRYLEGGEALVKATKRKLEMSGEE